MKRRLFLSTALLGASGLLSSCGGGDDSGTPLPDGTLPEGAPLRELDVLPNESAIAGEFRATLTAAPGPASVVAGRTTNLFLYNGMSPGPQIDLREGQHVRIRLDNQLSDETTIHWHGLPVPPDQDGNPMDPGRRGDESPV